MAVRPSTDHVTLRATGLAARLRFDEATLGHSGLGLEFEREGLPAFSAPDREAAGCSHAAYALDPDGSNVEAVRHTRSPFVENRVRP
jgi:hypothetical protein